MRSPFATLQELTIPAGAQSGTPRFYIGKRMPADLIAHYSPDTIIGGWLSFDAAGRYHYDISVIRTSTAEVYEVRGYSDPSVSFVQGLIGEDYDTSLHTANVQISNLEIPFNSSLTLDSGSTFTIDGVSAPRGPRNANKCTAGNIAASTLTTEVAIPSANYDVEPTYAFQPGRLYKLTLTCNAYQSTGTESSTRVRIRSGPQTTSGAVLGTFAVALPATLGTLGLAQAFTFISYCTNNTVSTVVTALSITNQRVGGAATTQLYGDSTIPIRMFVEDVGRTADNPGIAAASI